MGAFHGGAKRRREGGKKRCRRSSTKKGPDRVRTPNRPEALNALDDELNDALWEVWADFSADDSVDAAIVTGAGKAFCSGADLRLSRSGGATLLDARKNAARGIGGGITRGSTGSPSRSSRPSTVSLSGAASNWLLRAISASPRKRRNSGCSRCRQGWTPGRRGDRPPRRHRRGRHRTRPDADGAGGFRGGGVPAGSLNKVVPHEELLPTAESWARMILANGSRRSGPPRRRSSRSSAARWTTRRGSKPSTDIRASGISGRSGEVEMFWDISLINDERYQGKRSSGNYYSWRCRDVGSSDHVSRRRLPWHCDHMGHMNVMWYVGKFDEATWQFFAMFGLTPSFLREQGRGMAAVQQNITYKRELRAGDVVSIRSGVLEIREKVIRFFHEMYNDETGEIAATTELTGVHLDAREELVPVSWYVFERRRAMILPGEVAAQARMGRE